MKRFSFGNDEIVYDDSAEICIKCIEIFTDKLDCLDDFRACLEGAENVGKMLAIAPSQAQKYIDQALKTGVDFLLKFEIYEYSAERLKKQYDSLNYMNGKYYLTLAKEYKDLCEQNQQYEAQKQFERNNRSRWQGGGFGFRGAIKGAIKAGVMNMATDAVRGIGDSISDAADSKAFERKIREGSSDTIEILVSELEEIIKWSIPGCILGILKTGINLDVSIIMESSFERAEGILSNLDRMDSWDEKRNILKTLLERDVTVSEVFKYLLANSFSLGVEWKDAAAITGWVAPWVLASYKKKDIFSDIDFAERETDEYREAYTRLLQKAIRYEYINESRSVVPQDNKMGYIIGNYVLLALANLELQMQAKSGEKIVDTISHASASNLETLYNNILDIMRRNQVLDPTDNWKLVIKFENLKKSLSYIRIAEVLILLKKEYEKACKADGRTFLSLSEANVYRKELKQFTDIYSLGKSYADYESLKLQECIERLETINFFDPVLNQRRNELQNKLTILKEHEESDNYKRGMNLKEEFKNKGISNLFGYGDPGFLERAYKATMCSQVAKAEAQPYVLMVYDKSEKGSIKGIVLTESYIYNLMGLMMTSSGKISIDAILSITAYSNIVQILLKDNKIIKWKFANEVPVDGIVKGLKKGLALEEGRPGIDMQKDLGVQTHQDESIEKNTKVKDEQGGLKRREPLEQQRNLDMTKKREREQLQKEKEELKIQQDEMKEKEQMLSKVQEELERRKVRGIIYETIEEADKAREENTQIDHLKNRLLTTKSQKKRKIILGEFCCEVHTADAQNRYQQIKDKVNQEIPKSIFLCRILGMSLIVALILLFVIEIIGGMEDFSVAVTAWLCIGFWVWIVSKIVLIIKKFSSKHYLNIKNI